MIRRALLALVVIALLPASAHAAPGKVAIGIQGETSAQVLAALAARTTGGTVDDGLEDLGALVVTVPDVDAALEQLAELPGVEYAEPVVRSRRLAFQPNDPLLLFQWYVNAIRAFDFWDALPSLAVEPIRVAVIDSGIDASHPEFQGRIAEARSFVKGRSTDDTIGHGTVVAGEIAAALDNAEGIAGIGFPVELLIAKVTAPDGSISLEAEADAIHWAVANEADVINLSLGGLRDPKNPVLDQYSILEDKAIAYAYRSGAIVVAAAGNCDFAGCPYPYASWPAALPHVLGVSALDQSGETPIFSNRDRVFNDLAAPGVGIVSTFPRDMTNETCGWPGYNICPLPGVNPETQGTSFSAPLASAAAALLLAQKPQLLPSQVMTLLEVTAADIGKRGRDPLTGQGRLDIAAALGALALPLPADRHETNDDAGGDAWTLYGKRPRVSASIDYFDDPRDVYRVYLRNGQRVRIALDGPAGTRPTVVLWKVGTKHVTDVTALAVRSGSVLAFRAALNPVITYRVRRTGWHFVEVKAPNGRRGAYTLTLTRSAG